MRAPRQTFAFKLRRAVRRGFESVGLLREKSDQDGPHAGSAFQPPDVLTERNGLARVRVACILDEFTFTSFNDECVLLQLTPGDWKAKLEDFVPDLFFVESAWRGKQDLWQGKVRRVSKELRAILDWCREHNVPSVFWGKEDPTHFLRFLPLAREVDYVFTTDIDCIPRYIAELGHDRVDLLQFACQPTLTNPIEKYERKDAFCFAGSYYLQYPRRQRDFAALMAALHPLAPVEIYDRHHGSDNPERQFPEEYQQWIRGTLPFDQIDVAYKGYLYGVNMNTIKQSQTMFARRVFELLASNTIAVGNFSRGVRTTFGELTLSSDNAEELAGRLRALREDAGYQRAFRLAGLRKVLSEHTYAHRWASIASRVWKRPFAPKPAEVLMLGYAANQEDAKNLADSMSRQLWPHATGLIFLEDAAQKPPDLPGALQVRPMDGQSEHSLASLSEGAEWVAVLSPRDYYGPNYVTDLALATSYATELVITKAAHFESDAGTLVLRNNGSQYRPVQHAAAERSLIHRSRLESLSVSQLKDETLNSHLMSCDGFATDEFNYCKHGISIPQADLARVNATLPLWTGMSTTDWQQAAQRARAVDTQGLVFDDSSQCFKKSAQDLAALFRAASNDDVRFKLDGDHLHVVRDISVSKPQSIFAAETFSLDALNLSTNHHASLRARGKLSVSVVFEFLRSDGDLLSRAVLPSGISLALPVRAEANAVRLGLQVSGKGDARIFELILDEMPSVPTVWVSHSKALLVTRHYPSYEQPADEADIHGRTMERAVHEGPLEVFHLNADTSPSFREYHGVDILEGSSDLLMRLLSARTDSHFILHQPDAALLSSFERRIKREQLTIWSG